MASANSTTPPFTEDHRDLLLSFLQIAASASNRALKRAPDGPVRRLVASASDCLALAQRQVRSPLHERSA